MSVVQAYKVFNPDWTCRGFQYEVGKKYTCDKVIICWEGFHACLKLPHCFSYYEFDCRNKVAIVHMSGEIVYHKDDTKVAATEITIIKELSWEEVLFHSNVGSNNYGSNNGGCCNYGDTNNGYYNQGDMNIGSYNRGRLNVGSNNIGSHNLGSSNIGNCNIGSKNIGNYNSGSYNLCNYSSGIFCTVTPTVMSFNKPTSMTYEDFMRYGIRPDFTHLKMTEWIPLECMSNDEKIAHPEAKTTGGYLKTKTYRQAWADWKAICTQENWERVLKLPNFDADIFEQITGIKV